MSRSQSISPEWVKGHAEHPENTRCDEMAVLARQADALPADGVYERLENAVKVEQLNLPL